MAVRQMPLVVEAGDDAAADEAAVRCYRDVLGLPVELALDSEGGARVTIMEAGRATLEIVNPARRRMIDEVEARRRVRPRGGPTR